MLSALQEIVADRHAHVAALRAVTALFLFWLDPLGLAVQKSQLIDQRTAWIVSNLRPRPPSEKIAVVLIGDDDLSSAHFRMDWPLTYDKTASLIHAVACAEATGMFLDFTPSSRFNLAEGQAELLDVTLDSSSGPYCDDGRPASRIPVYWGRIEGIETPVSRLLRKRGLSFSLNAGADDAVYPAAQEEFPHKPLERSARTPAFAVMAAACDKDTPIDGICDRGRPESSIAPLRLSWTPMISQSQKDVSNSVLPGEGCRGPARLFEIILALAIDEAADYEPCPPLLTLRARDLFRDPSFVAKSGNPASSLRGRFVFVGADLAGLNDKVTSPVHGELPGVFKHAVALDNLIAMGRSYPTKPSKLTLLALAAIIILYLEFAKELCRPAGARTGWHMGAVLAIMSGMALLIWWAYWPVSIWFALFGYYLSTDFFVGAMRKYDAKA